MRTLIASLIAICFASAGFAGAFAQQAEMSYSDGPESPATWSDSRGNVLATMQVMDVNPDWLDFAEGDAPDRGFVYQAVSFSVTNVSDTEIELRSNDFTLIDGYGRWLTRASVTIADDATYEIFNDGVPLGAGESSELVMVFETPSTVPAGLFVWEPESNSMAVVNLADEDIENGAVVVGLNTPSTWTDDRGNVLATLQVIEVNPDWLNYAENYAPARGSIYQAVQFTITNESDDMLVVNPSSFTMMDNSGVNLRIERPNVAEDSEDEVFIEGVELAPGESISSMLVFINFSGLEPTAIFWQPENGLVNVVVVQDSGAPTDTDATPVG